VKQSRTRNPWSPARAAVLGFALLTLFSLGACRETPAAPNIVVMVQDTTVRPDRLSVYGHPKPTSPFLDAFAASGVRFDRVYLSSSWTLPGQGFDFKRKFNFRSPSDVAAYFVFQQRGAHSMRESDSTAQRNEAVKTQRIRRPLP